MSVWLGGEHFYGRLYGTLSRINKSPNSSGDQKFRRHLMAAFPQIKWRESKDPVKDLCVKLWRLNARAYNGRYGENAKISAADIKGMLRNASEVDDIQLFKDVGCIEYQCCETGTDHLKLFKQLQDFESRLGVAIAMSLPAYQQAKWG